MRFLLNSYKKCERDGELSLVFLKSDVLLPALGVPVWHGTALGNVTRGVPRLFLQQKPPILSWLLQHSRAAPLAEDPLAS